MHVCRLSAGPQAADVRLEDAIDNRDVTGTKETRVICKCHTKFMPSLLAPLLLTPHKVARHALWVLQSDPVQSELCKQGAKVTGACCTSFRFSRPLLIP